MTWVLYGLLTAVFRSLTDVSSKMGLRNLNEYVVAWSLNFFSLPLLYLTLPFIEIPKIGPNFWIALLFGGGGNLLTAVFYMKALRHSDLSITIPMVSFTPLFLLITSPLILGEFPSIYGFFGILLIVFGTYVLNINTRKSGFFEPFKALLHEKGPRYMLLVAFIWSITSNMDKMGIQNSSPLFWLISVNTFITITMLPILTLYAKKPVKQISLNWKILIAIGIFNALTLVFQMMAYNLTLVAYVISIKRSSIIISVILGALLFKEKGLEERLAGTILMILGVLLITLF